MSFAPWENSPSLLGVRHTHTRTWLPACQGMLDRCCCGATGGVAAAEYVPLLQQHYTHAAIDAYGARGGSEPRDPRELVALLRNESLPPSHLAGMRPSTPTAADQPAHAPPQAGLAVAHAIHNMNTVPPAFVVAMASLLARRMHRVRATVAALPRIGVSRNGSDGTTQSMVMSQQVRLQDTLTSLRNCASDDFVVGTRIKGNYHLAGRWYPGRISRTHSDGTVDIRYAACPPFLRVQQHTPQHQGLVFVQI